MDEGTSATGDRMSVVLDQPIPQRLRLLRVDYEPGGSSPWPHRHPGGAFVYVIDGAVRLGLEGEEPRIVGAGETFYEPPDAVHAVSENASRFESASLLAVLIGAEGQPPAVPAG